MPNEEQFTNKKLQRNSLILEGLSQNSYVLFYLDLSKMFVAV